MRSLYDFDRPYYQLGPFVIGVDEAGRGPLAGPVTAAACYLPSSFYLEGLNDSKKLTALKREKLFKQLTTDTTVNYSLGWVSPEEIDCLNIYQASKLAMLRAIEGLNKSQAIILVDAMPLQVEGSQVYSFIKGDGLSQVIAAASILAKVSRDLYMQELDLHFPGYGFAKHKGYPTSLHVQALSQLGPSPHHRHSFKPVRLNQELRSEEPTQ